MSTSTPPATTAGPTLRGLARAAPADRDRAVDFLRGLSILCVAVGHWLLAVVRTDADGELVAGNALGELPGLAPLTWAMQVMPLFFLVGGTANLRSLRSARRRGESTSSWLAGRLRRLTGPTFVAVITWAVVAGAVVAGGLLDTELVRLAARLVAVPLWFLAVYVLAVAVAPVMARLHARGGLLVPAALASAATAVDLAVRAGLEPLGWLNFVFVWLVPQQLGFCWVDGRFRGRGWPAGLTLAGFASMVALTVVGPYPVSVVGIPGAVATNNSPPTVVLVALAVLQLGLALLVAPRLRTWLARSPGAWLAVVAVNARAMSIYLWHLPALVLVGATLVPAGLTPDADTGTALWWLGRPLWLAQLTLALLAVLAVVGRAERLGTARPAPPAGRAAAATVALVAGFGLLAAHGVPLPGVGAAASTAGVAAIAGAAALLAVPSGSADPNRRR